MLRADLSSPTAARNARGWAGVERTAPAPANRNCFVLGNHGRSPAEVTRNRELSLKRRPVEAVFGTLKRHYGFYRMRYFSAARNAVALRTHHLQARAP